MIRLISKFKDYYDYLAYQYYDAEYTWERHTITDVLTLSEKYEYKFTHNTDYFYSVWSRKVEYSFGSDKYLPVIWLNDKIYYKLEYNTFALEWDKNLNTKIENGIEKFKKGRPDIFNQSPLVLIMLKLPKETPRKIENFHIDSFSINPNLSITEYNDKSIKLSGIIPPEQLLQEVLAWFSNRGDIDIPNNQTDKEKILSHGFDLKASFRNLKKKNK